MNLRFTTFAVILLAAVGLSCWLTLIFVQKKLMHNDEKPNRPDMFMRDIAYRQFDENGILRNELSAPNALHYPQEDEYRFTEPKIKVTDAKKQPWEISSASGRSKNSEQIIELDGSAKIKQFDAVSRTPILEIETEALTFYPQSKFAEASRLVTIAQQGSTVKTLGAKLDLNTGKLQLLSHVRVQYVPIK